MKHLIFLLLFFSGIVFANYPVIQASKSGKKAAIQIDGDSDLINLTNEKIVLKSSSKNITARVVGYRKGNRFLLVETDSGRFEVGQEFKEIKTRSSATSSNKRQSVSKKVSEPRSKKNYSLFVNPLAYVFKVIQADFEMKWGPKRSITVGGFYFSDEEKDDVLGTLETTAIGLSSYYRFYFSQKPLEGFYAGVGFSIASTTLSVVGQSATTFLMGPSGTGAYRFVFGSFGIELGGIVTYYLGSVQAGTKTSALEGIYFAGNLGFGYVW